MVDLNSAHEHARLLRDQFGADAVNVATKKEQDARDAGRDGDADDWARIRKILRESRTPRES